MEQFVMRFNYTQVDYLEIRYIVLEMVICFIPFIYFGCQLLKSCIKISVFLHAVILITLKSHLGFKKKYKLLFK